MSESSLGSTGGGVADGTAVLVGGMAVSVGGTGVGLGMGVFVGSEVMGFAGAPAQLDRSQAIPVIVVTMKIIFLFILPSLIMSYCRSALSIRVAINYG